MRKPYDAARVFFVCVLMAPGLWRGPLNAGEAGVEQTAKASGVYGGLCVQLGCTDGGVAVELAQGGRFLVHALTFERGILEKVQQGIEKKGHYGQVTADLLTGPALPYASNVVNLLLAEDPGRVPQDEMLRVVRPLGLLCVKQKNGWTTTRKPWPQGLAEWTHTRNGADGNPVSADTLELPKRIQWVSGKGNRDFLTGGGCLYSGGVEVRDAFNHLPLWRQTIRMCAAAGDRLYGLSGPSLVALDARDGTTVKTTTLLIPKGGTAKLDGSDSRDTDENGASIVEYFWTFDNLTTPEDDRFSSAPSAAAFLDQVLTVPGEYLVTLTVKDDEGEFSTPNASDSHVTIKVVEVKFDPTSITVTEGETATTKATIVPSSAVADVDFRVNDTTIATATPAKLTATPDDLTVKGVKAGTTKLLAEITTSLGSERVGSADIQVTEPFGATASISPAVAEHRPFETAGIGNVPEDTSGQAGALLGLGDPVVIPWVLNLGTHGPGQAGVRITVTVRPPGGAAGIPILAETRILLGNPIPANADANLRVRFLTNNGNLQVGANVIEWRGRLATGIVPANGSQVLVTIVPFKVVNNRDVLFAAADSQINVRILNALAVGFGNANRNPAGSFEYQFQASKPLDLYASIPTQSGGGLKEHTQNSSNIFVILKDDNSNGQNDDGFTPVTIADTSVHALAAEFKTELQGKWSMSGVQPGRYLVSARCNMATEPLQIAVTGQPEVIIIKRSPFFLVRRGGNASLFDGEEVDTRFSIETLSSERIPQGTTFQWKFSFPGAHFQVLKEPKITFSHPTGKNTKLVGPIYWYADKDFTADPCAPSLIVRYQIECEISVPGKPKETLADSISVIADMNPGRTTHEVELQRESRVRQMVRDALRWIDDDLTPGYKFAEIDGSAITQGEPKVTIRIPPSSQFYDKTKKHEAEHFNQFKGTGTPNLSDWWSVKRAKEYINKKLKNKFYPGNPPNGDKRQAAIEKAKADVEFAFGEFVKKESDDWKDRVYKNEELKAAIEKPAYDVSDEIPPKVLGQGQCVLHNKGPLANEVPPLPIDNLLNAP